MRANEFLKEIERIGRYDFVGGKEYLSVGQSVKQYKKLPGGSGFLYTIQEFRSSGNTIIKLWDPAGPEAVRRQPQIIGKLSLERNRGFPLTNALQVYTITVDEDYRGRGIAKALYGIVLTIMKRPLLAGDSQTPGGRRNWVSLSQIPGVSMKGYVGIEDVELDYEKQAYPAGQRSVEHTIDTIMGKLGGEYIGKGKYGLEFFAFDVKPTTSGKELEAYVKTNLSKVYDGSYSLINGLYATWTGQI